MAPNKPLLISPYTIPYAANTYTKPLLRSYLNYHHSFDFVIPFLGGYYDGSSDVLASACTHTIEVAIIGLIWVR